MTSSIGHQALAHQWTMSDSEEDDFSDTNSVPGDSDLETEVESSDEDEVYADTNDVPAAEQRQPWIRVFPPEDIDDDEDGAFAEVTGPKNMPESDAKPVKYFHLYLTLGLLQQIVTETNRYTAL